MIFTPRHFSGVAMQVAATNPMMDAKLGTTEPREVGLGLIGASAVLAKRDGMVDAVHFVMGMKCVPSARLVSVNGRAKWNALPNGGDAFTLTLEYERKRPTAALADHHHYAALAGLFLSEPPVRAIFRLVFLFDVTAEVRAVDFDRTGELDAALFRLNCFPQFVRQHESGPVLAIEVAAQLERAMALRAVAEIAMAKR